MATVSAHPTPAREAAVRGSHSIPWTTVLVFAAALASADGFWLVSLQGATGAVGRTDHPFATWMRESTVLLPVFALAVLAALTLALRRCGPDPDKKATAVVTALLVVAAGTAAGLAVVVVNSVYDYHVQSAQLQVVHELSSLHGHCDSTCLRHEKQDTLAVQLRGLVVVSRWILLTNLVLVSWIAALMGGRIRLSAARRRTAGPAVLETVSEAAAEQVRRLLAWALAAGAAIHAAMLAENLTAGTTAATVFWALFTVGAVAVAGLLVAGVLPRETLYAAAGVTLGPLLLWMYGWSGPPPRPNPYPAGQGISGVLALTLGVGSVLAALTLVRSPRWLTRRRRASSHIHGLLVLTLISIATIGVATTS